MISSRNRRENDEERKNKYPMAASVIGNPCLLFALYNGASEVKGNEVWQALFQFDPTDQAQQIIRNIRLPRVIWSIYCG